MSCSEGKECCSLNSKLSPYSSEYSVPWILKPTKPKVGHWKLGSCFGNLNLLGFSNPRILISQHHLRIAAIAASPNSAWKKFQAELGGKWPHTNTGLEHYLTQILHISSYYKLRNLIVFHELPLAVIKNWWDTRGTNAHWKQFSSLSPENKDRLGTGSFHEKLSQPLLANVLGIWSNSGLQFSFLSPFCFVLPL